MYLFPSESALSKCAIQHIYLFIRRTSVSYLCYELCLANVSSDTGK